LEKFMVKKEHLVKFSSVEPRFQELIDFCKRNPRLVIQLAGKLWSFYLRGFIPGLMLNGHSDYTKFVIAGRSRTGSNLLRGSLMSHSRIVVFGDIFRDRGAIQWGIPFYPQSERLLSLFQNDPARFAETQVFGRFPTRVSAVGFKILYPLAHSESKEPVLAYLENQNALRMIHIKRKNILKAHLSHKRVQGGRWSNISGSNKDNHPPIHIEYEECLRAFIRTREREREYDSFFDDHQKIDVLYENLCSDYEGEVRRIQEFLSVDNEVVKPLTYKQFRQPLSKAISNYSELKERFTGTEWEEFFED
jgi:LPS sulfotransferase NodH